MLNSSPLVSGLTRARHASRCLCLGSPSLPLRYVLRSTPRAPAKAHLPSILPKPSLEARASCSRCRAFDHLHPPLSALTAASA